MTDETQLCFALTVDNGTPPDNADVDEAIVIVSSYPTPTVLLDLNAGSFGAGDPMLLTLRVLTPPTGGPFPVALCWWLKLPSGDRINLLYVPTSLPAGFDTGELPLINGPMPSDLPAGSYELSVLLEDVGSREDISVSTVFFEVQ